jgi:hypothetical protein
MELNQKLFKIPVSVMLLLEQIDIEHKCEAKGKQIVIEPKCSVNPKKNFES